MVRHVNRLIEPTTGRIKGLGRDVLALSEDELLKLRATHLGIRHGVPAHGAVSAPHGARQRGIPPSGAGPAEVEAPGACSSTPSAAALHEAERQETGGVRARAVTVRA